MKTEFYESESNKLVSYYDDQKHVACANDDPKTVKQSRKELGQRKCVFEPVTAKFLFTMLLNAKPNVSAEVTKRMKDSGLSFDKLC
jgi:hypothetical protein